MYTYTCIRYIYIYIYIYIYTYYIPRPLFIPVRELHLLFALGGRHLFLVLAHDPLGFRLRPTRRKPVCVCVYCMYICICMYVCMYIYVCMYVCMYMYTLYM